MVKGGLTNCPYYKELRDFLTPEFLLPIGVTIPKKGAKVLRNKELGKQKSKFLFLKKVTF